jgi:hypothetical protein
METLIAILIWLRVIAPGETYTSSQFNTLVEQNSQQISLITNDQYQLGNVTANTANQASEIIIISN